MDLPTYRSAQRRARVERRVGAYMVIAALLVSLTVTAPKAKAASAASAVPALTWGFMQSAGLRFSANGMDRNAFIDALASYIHKFEQNVAEAKDGFLQWLGYSSEEELTGSLQFALTQVGTAKLFIPSSVARKLAQFTQWFAEEIGLTSGGESVPVIDSQYYATLTDGTKLSLGYTTGSAYNAPGSPLLYPGERWDFPSGAYVDYFSDSTSSYEVTLRVGYPKQNQPSSILTFEIKTTGGAFCLARTPGNGIAFMYNRLGSNGTRSWDCSYPSNTAYLWTVFVADTLSADLSASQPGVIDAPVDDTDQDRDTVISIPGVGAEVSSTDELLQTILDKLAANELTAEGSIAEEAQPDTPTDVDDLGLPALGAALVSRFPFSIPWDIVRGIKLVAAPAEAPRWEVDFLAPIADRVGGWEGSTTVVLDMGEYPIVGQLCRWTSTIGFCLLLAAGTKKLIWTA